MQPPPGVDTYLHHMVNTECCGQTQRFVRVSLQQILTMWWRTSWYIRVHATANIHIQRNVCCVALKARQTRKYALSITISQSDWFMASASLPRPPYHNHRPIRKRKSAELWQNYASTSVSCTKPIHRFTKSCMRVSSPYSKTDQVTKNVNNPGFEQL